MNQFVEIPWQSLALSAGATLVLTAIAVPLLIRLAKKAKLFDLPGGRHIHAQPTPRLGGIAIYVATLIAAIIFVGITPQLFGLYLGTTIIFAVGLADDLYGLSPGFKLLAQVLAAATLVVFGITISNLTNPFGGTLLIPPVWDTMLTLIWVVLIVNTINFLDGVDGLAAGVASVASLVIAALSLFAIVNQPETAHLASILLGASLGFLIYNWHPAKIFMGDSGSHTLGLMLAGLAVLSGSKLATAALVLGFPILDLVTVAVRRMRLGQAPWTADRSHLHHRLLDSGLSQRIAVILLLGVSAALGLVALLSGTQAKIFSFLLAILLLWFLLYLSKPRNK